MNISILTLIYNLEIKNFCQEILEDKHSTKYFKNFIINLNLI